MWGHILCGRIEGSTCQGKEILLLLMFLLGLGESKLLACIINFAISQSLLTYINLLLYIVLCEGSAWCCLLQELLLDVEAVVRPAEAVV